MIVAAVFGPAVPSVVLEFISQFYAIGMPALAVLGAGCFLASR